MYTRLFNSSKHFIHEASQALLPATIEQTAGRIFESFSDRLKAMLNGRQDRALKLALEGHVTHKAGRIFSVRSEDQKHAYLVDLERSTCTCPDCQKGNICKHRLAAYLIEQASTTEALVECTPDVHSNPLDPAEEKVETARSVLNARSECLREAIIYAMLPQNGDLMAVEVISIEGDTALVRALPRLDPEKGPVPQFPFAEGQSSAMVVLARSLRDIQIYR